MQPRVFKKNRRFSAVVTGAPVGVLMTFAVLSPLFSVFTQPITDAIYVLKADL